MNDQMLSFEEWKRLQSKEMEHIFKIYGSSSKPVQPEQGKLVTVKEIKQ